MGSTSCGTLFKPKVAIISIRPRKVEQFIIYVEVLHEHVTKIVRTFTDRSLKIKYKLLQNYVYFIETEFKKFISSIIYPIVFVHGLQ